MRRMPPPPSGATSTAATRSFAVSAGDGGFRDDRDAGVPGSERQRAVERQPCARIDDRRDLDARSAGARAPLRRRDRCSRRSRRAIPAAPRNARCRCARRPPASFPADRCSRRRCRVRAHRSRARPIWRGLSTGVGAASNSALRLREGPRNPRMSTPPRWTPAGDPRRARSGRRDRRRSSRTPWFATTT